jgi:hypothetical protein
MKAALILVCPLVLSQVFAAPAFAGQCGFENCWGAIVFSRTGHVGTAATEWSQERAYQAAQKDCRWNCTEIRTFKNTCAALATGEKARAAWARGNSLKEAEYQATYQCGSHFRNCKIVASVCSK